jgi:arylsulfatase
VEALQSRAAVALVLALIATSLSSCGPPENGPVALEPRRGINVVVVSADALRRDALGTYGSARPTSPHIDAFARGALVFENAYTVSSVTATSFAASLTGRYSPRVFRKWRLRSDLTLASVFRDAGYSTAAFMNNPQLYAGRGFGMGFDTYEVFPALPDPQALDRALGWLEAKSSGPFLLWLHFIDPHTPWERNPAAAGFFDPSYDGKYPERAPAMRVAEPSEVEQLRRLYDGEVMAVDRLFGRLIERLVGLGVRENTIVVFTSDHGEEFMEHGFLQHGRLTEENVAIPLILSHPDLPGGRRIASRVSNLDLLTTLAALAGIALDEETDGRNLLAPASAAPLLGIVDTGKTRQASIRRGDLKLIVHCWRRGQNRELFDLALDPGERHNLLLDQLPIADRLEEELWQTVGLAGCSKLRMGRAPKDERGTDGLTREVTEALQELGYLEEQSPPPP